MTPERLREIEDRQSWPLDEWDIVSREDAAIRRRKYYDQAVSELLAEVNRLKADTARDAEVLDVLGQQAAEAVRLRAENERLREALKDSESALDRILYADISPHERPEKCVSPTDAAPRGEAECG